MPLAPNQWSKNAREYLEQLQQQTLLSAGRSPTCYMIGAPPEFTRTLTREIALRNRLAGGYEPVEAEVARLLSPDGMPTQYEFPPFYRMLHSLAEAIETAVDDRAYLNGVQALLGTIASGRMQAMSVAVPGTNEFLVLFEVGLFGFLNLIAKIVARLLGPQLQSDTLSQSVSADVEITQDDLHRFLDALTSYVVLGNPLDAEQYFQEATTSLLSSQLLASAELFVVGHEYGHILEGHFERSKLSRGAPFAPEANEVHRSWAEEFTADFRGIELTLSACRGNNIDRSIGVAGAFFFFECAELIEMTAAALQLGTDGQRQLNERTREMAAALKDINSGDASFSALGTHPPAFVRGRMLFDMFEQIYPNHTVIAAQVLCKSIEALLHELFIKSLPTILRLHRRGVRPAPQWDRTY